MVGVRRDRRERHHAYTATAALRDRLLTEVSPFLGPSDWLCTFRFIDSKRSNGLEKCTRFGRRLNIKGLLQRVVQALVLQKGDRKSTRLNFQSRGLISYAV